jgi:hypothetical protein
VLVDIDSGSYDKEGVDQVGVQIRNFLVDAGLIDPAWENLNYAA